MKRVLVVFSGGQDSTTCLYWAIKNFQRENVYTVTFDYEQRHVVELDSAKKIAELADVRNTILPINTFSAIGGNSLTADIDLPDESTGITDIPNTFVPGRNLIFLTYAAALAYQHDIKDLVTGVAQTDYSGYPDCREDTIQALQKAITLGMEHDVTIHTPLMYKSKKETVEMAKEYGALDSMAYSHTCYDGQQPPCGNCAACVLRAKGFAEAGIPDPLVTRFLGGT
jgi:7-cyano-7-deazaguanine synthase